MTKVRVFAWLYRGGRASVDGKVQLKRYRFEDRKAETVLPEATGYWLTANAKKVLCRAGDSWSIVTTAAKPDPGKGKLDTEATEGRVAYVYVPNTTTLGHSYFKR